MAHFKQRWAFVESVCVEAHHHPLSLHAIIRDVGLQPYTPMGGRCLFLTRFGYYGTPIVHYEPRHVSTCITVLYASIEYSKTLLGTKNKRGAGIGVNLGGTRICRPLDVTTTSMRTIPCTSE